MVIGGEFDRACEGASCIFRSADFLICQAEVIMVGGAFGLQPRRLPKQHEGHLPIASDTVDPAEGVGCRCTGRKPLKGLFGQFEGQIQPVSCFSTQELSSKMIRRFFYPANLAPERALYVLLSFPVVGDFSLMRWRWSGRRTVEFSHTLARSL